MHRTAIKRSKLSQPMQWLLDTHELNPTQRILDYGCGRGDDIRLLLADHNIHAAGYDPNNPAFDVCPIGTFDVITCNYVMNVVESPTDRAAIEQTIIDLLSTHGKAFITVRNDAINCNGTTSIGTWQGIVAPSDRFTLLRTTSGYRLYYYTRP